MHIRDVLDADRRCAHPELIEKFGGHAMAAGLTLRAARLDRFARGFDDEVRRWMTVDDAVGVVHSDGELSGREIARSTSRGCCSRPGRGVRPFPSRVRRLFPVRSPRIVGERHLKMDLQDGRRSGLFDAIAFKHIDDADAPAVRPDARGRAGLPARRQPVQRLEQVQLLVEYLRCCSGS